MIKKNKKIGILLLIAGSMIPLIFLTKTKIEEKIEIVELTEKTQNNGDYFAIIEIPKINIKKELYKIDDERNDVEKNVLVHNQSTFPELKKSNVILAGHSGLGSNAYFKKLYQLNLGDKIILYYHNQIYEYEIKEIEYQEKTGNLYLKEEFTTMVTLITCTYKDNNNQTIYYAELKNTKKLI